MKLINCSTGVIIAVRVAQADRFISRLVGLMGKKEMPFGSALVLWPCNQIHTFFMRFNIDVIFLDRGFQVKLIIENMQPWRISRLVWGAHIVVELLGGALQGRVSSGDKLKIEE